MKFSLPIISILTLILFFVNSPLALAETSSLDTSTLNPLTVGHVATPTADLHTNHDSSISGITHLNLCQDRHDALKTRMSNVTNYISKNEDMLDLTAQKVEDYYTTKFVPSGKIIPNYQSLTSDISSKSAVLKTIVVQSQSDADSFNCTNNPGVGLKKFNTDLENAKQDLRAYQLSIKNLITALRSLLPSTTIIKNIKEGSRSAEASVSTQIK